MRTIRLIKILFIIICFQTNSFAQSEKVVRLKGNDFYLNGNKFFPLFVNYAVVFARDAQGNIYPSPNQAYFASGGMECTDENGCYQEILNDFIDIKTMGFNSIRLCGLVFGTQGNSYPNPAITTYTSSYGIQDFPISAPYTNIFHCIDKVLEAAEEAGIKVQLLTGGNQIVEPAILPLYTNYLAALAERYKNNTTLYSYDFMNEPRTNDHTSNTKFDVCSIVGYWNDAVKSHTTNQLTTIGLLSTDEVFTWDPGILKVDFISMHAYGTIDHFRNQVKWLSDNCKLPWIIGENGFRACTCAPNQTIEHVDGTENDQKLYIKTAMETTRDCGGKGYGWWQYKDVFWGAEDPLTGKTGDYYGLVRKNTEFKKPAAAEVLLFQPFAQNPSGCPYTSSYYYSCPTTNNYAYVGRVLHASTLQPVKGAVIYSYSSNWTADARAFSNANGDFTVCSSEPIDKIRISAPGANVIFRDGDLNQGANYQLSFPAPTQSNVTITGWNIVNSQDLNVEASNEIQISNSTISGNGSSSYKLYLNGTNRVRLNNGFKVLQGGRFKANNRPVYINCGSIISNINALVANPNESELIAKLPDDTYLSTDNLSNNHGISISPNPSTGLFHVVSSSENIETIVVMDLTGKTILTVKPKSSRTELDLSEQANGCYLLQIYSENHSYKKKVFLSDN